ncbi:MAG: PIG-L family deacetylase [Mogibacterium sp.]|nr:PIG-L family deacetylase [Mogibacterium sp.]
MKGTKKRISNTGAVIAVILLLLSAIAISAFANEGGVFRTQSKEAPAAAGAAFAADVHEETTLAVNAAAQILSVENADLYEPEISAEPAAETVQEASQPAESRSSIYPTVIEFNITDAELEGSSTKPGTPTILSAVNNVKNGVQLTWTVAADATGYGIFRLNESYNIWECLMAVDGANTTTATVTGLPTNTGSTFRVAAIKTTDRVTVQGVKSDPVSVYVTGAAGKITDALLRKNSIDSCTKLMIVAHPDDETLWGGGHMMSGDWFIVCLTNGDNKIRSKEYENVMKFTKNHGIILNYPDTLKGGGRSWWTKEDSDIRSDLNKLLNYKDWEVIVTHNPDGGTGHQHHILTCQKVTDICSVNGLLNKLYYHGIFYPKGTPIPADTPRLTPAEEAFKRKALAYYEHEKEAIKLFWAQMIPFEDWILSTDWEEVKAELAAAGIGLEDLYDEEVLDEEVLFEEELLEEEQTDEELADESLTVAEEPEDVPAAEVEAPAADEEPAAEVEPVVDEAPAAEEPSAEAEPVQDAVQEIPAE